MLLTLLIRNRKTSLLISGAAILQGISVYHGLPGWRCPLLYGLGIPCPGCGLSRALVALLNGEWQDSLSLHAFALPLLIALLLIGLAGVLPERQRNALGDAVAFVERRTQLAMVLLVGLVGYWAARMLIDPLAFITLLRG